MNVRLLLALVAAIATHPLFAQLGDRVQEGAEIPPPAARHIVPAPPLSAREEERTFQAPPGFRIELVADESLVQDPVAAVYDGDGNLWVCQDTRYNAMILDKYPDLAAGATSVPAGKIVLLKSSRHDGHFDQRTVWLDGLNEPRGIALVREGLLIADPPQLWLARDRHGAGRCDEKTLLIRNYGIAGSQEYSGSLLWGQDGLIHNVCASHDYRYRGGAIVETPAVQIRGQYGLSQDDFGRLFYNNNSDQLRGDLYSAEYGTRNPGLESPPWVNYRIAADQETWPSHPTPAVNRGYRPGVLGKSTGGLREDGTLLEFTAACSPLIYRGRNFPARYYGNAFVPDASANLIKRNLLLESEGRITAVNAYDGREFLTSTDTRFRPVALVNAPDGSMLIVDMYRGIIEGAEYLTTYLHQQSVARGLERPMYGLGRIWKLVYDGGPLEPRRPDLARRNGAQLAALLSDANSWWRDTAEQEIVEGGAKDAVPALQDLARRAPDEATRVYALWTLDGLEALTPDFLRPALSDPSPKVRAAAVRLHERWLRSGEADRMVTQLSAVVRDPAPEVSVQLALTLGEARTPAATEAMADLLLAAGDHPFLPTALASGLAGREIEFLDRIVARAAGVNPPRPEFAATAAILVEAVGREGSGRRLPELVSRAGDSGGLPHWARLAVLQGLSRLVDSSSRGARASGGPLNSAMLAPLTGSSDAEVRADAGKLAVAIERAEALAQSRARFRPLTSDEQKRYEAGRATYLMCAACHQPTGTGLVNVAPSLVDSRWVGANPEVLARIVLDGKEGTPGFPSTMPPIGSALSDDQIARVLTYVRNSWGLHYGGVSPDSVARARRAVAGRGASWTDRSLELVAETLPP